VVINTHNFFINNNNKGNKRQKKCDDNGRLLTFWIIQVLVDGECGKVIGKVIHLFKIFVYMIDAYENMLYVKVTYTHSIHFDLQCSKMFYK
jgi:hypothetical protein